MRSKMKVGVLLSVMLFLALAGPSLASDLARPRTGINTDGYFPPHVNPICGFRVTVYGSKPENFYVDKRNPWKDPEIEEDPNNPGYWTLTFGDPKKGPCFSRDDDRFKECGVFKGLHFGFYTDDPIVNLLNPNPGIWSHVGPPCVYFGPNGEVPCTGLTSHSTGVLAGGRVDRVQIMNASVNASVDHGTVSQAFRIENARIAVAADIVPINNLGPCDLQHLAWEDVPLATSLLPASSDEGIGTLEVAIPEHIRDRNSGWAVMVYDVTDPETGAVLTTSTLTFPLGQE